MLMKSDVKMASYSINLIHVFTENMGGGGGGGVGYRLLLFYLAWESFLKHFPSQQYIIYLTFFAFNFLYNLIWYVILLYMLKPF